MPSSDAAPLPRAGEVFFDIRGNARTMRLSWYADTGVAVISIWQGGMCTSTFRLAVEDLPRMVQTLQRGPQQPGQYPQPEQPGQYPQTAGYQYPEQAGQQYPEPGQYPEPAGQQYPEPGQYPPQPAGQYPQSAGQYPQHGQHPASDPYYQPGPEYAQQPAGYAGFPGSPGGPGGPGQQPGGGPAYPGSAGDYPGHNGGAGSR